MATNESTNENLRNPIEELAEDFIRRRRSGEAVSIEEYAQEYPELESQIRHLFPTLELIENVRHSGNKAEADLENQTHIGQRLGDFQLLREIGRGGMGVVYEAIQLSLGRLVALKVLCPSLQKNKKYLERFQREARAAANLHHANIVPVYGAASESGYHFYVMQFVYGRGLDEVFDALCRRSTKNGDKAETSLPADSLANALATGEFRCEDLRIENSMIQGFEESGNDDTTPRFEGNEQKVVTSSKSQVQTETGTHNHSTYYRRIADLGKHAADAIAYAHRNGVLHRDIKPANLVLDVYGNIWITDFGLAKLSGEEGLTESGDIIGTLRYIAPECLKGKYDSRSDIYSLGLTLYEMLSLEKAFSAVSRGELTRQILERGPAPLKKLPRDLKTIIHKATALDPSHRYETATGLAEDLDRFLTNQPIKARHVSPIERAWRWARRNRAMAAVGSISLLILIAALVGSLLFSWKMQRLAKDKQQSLVVATKAQLKAIEAKEIATSEAEEAVRQMNYAKAIADFLKNDVLKLATISGRYFSGFDDDVAESELRTLRTLLDRAKDKLIDRDDIEPSAKAELLRIIGINYRLEGEHDQAIKILKQCYEIANEFCPDQPELLLNCSNSLAVALSEDGRHSEALTIHQNALIKLPADFPKSSVMLLVVKRELASNYIGIGELEKANAVLEPLLDEFDSHLENDHREMIVTKMLLGRLRRLQHRYDESLQTYNQAIESAERTLGDTHLITLHLLRDRARTYLEAGQIDEALKAYSEVLDVNHQQFPKDHPRTVQAANNFAASLWKAGKLDLSIPLFEKIVKNASRTLGDEHPSTITAKVNLAINYRDNKQFEKAISLFVLLERMSARPEWVDEELRSTYVLAGKKDEFKLLIKRQIDQARAKQEKQPVWFADLLVFIGSDAMKLQLAQEAETNFQEALKIMESEAPRHWKTPLARKFLADALYYQDKLTEAEVLLKQALLEFPDHKETMPDYEKRMERLKLRLSMISEAKGEHQN